MLTLHHIGILVPHIPNATEDYLRRFECKICSPIIHDPIQTAMVRFIKLDDGAGSYIELISPDGPASKLSNALKKGGGLNHLCYKTGDIDESCRNLRGQAMFLLHEPVAAIAFPGRRIAWLMGRDGIPIELVEQGEDKWQ